MTCNSRALFPSPCQADRGRGGGASLEVEEEQARSIPSLQALVQPDTEIQPRCYKRLRTVMLIWHHPRATTRFRARADTNWRSRCTQYEVNILARRTTYRCHAVASLL